jgi:hypothetical protein
LKRISKHIGQAPTPGSEEDIHLLQDFHTSESLPALPAPRAAGHSLHLPSSPISREVFELGQLDGLVEGTPAERRSRESRGRTEGGCHWAGIGYSKSANCSQIFFSLMSRAVLFLFFFLFGSAGV